MIAINNYQFLGVVAQPMNCANPKSMTGSLITTELTKAPIKRKAISISRHIDDLEKKFRLAKLTGRANSDMVTFQTNLANSAGGNEALKVRMSLDRLLFLKNNPNQIFMADVNNGKLYLLYQGVWYYLMSTNNTEGNAVWCKSFIQDFSSSADNKHYPIKY